MTLVCCGYICSYDRTWFLVLVFHSVGWWQLRHICDMVQTIGENSFMPIKAISLLRAFCLHWISPGIRPFKAKTIWVTKSSIYWSLPFHLIWQERLIWLTPGSCRGLLDISSGWYTILYPNLPFSCFPWDQDNTLFPVFSYDVSSYCLLFWETLYWCCEKSASKVISKKATPMDGQLFLIKHLLILREQVAIWLSLWKKIHLIC